VALVRVERGEIVHRETCLIRPPRKQFLFSYLHGITWDRVCNEPAFREAWPRLCPLLCGADFLAAHNADFDRCVLHTCCRMANLEPPALPFQCTVILARRTWAIHPTKLPDVCRFLGLPLQHHDPAADAEACARIVLAALNGRGPVKQGSNLPQGRLAATPRVGNWRRR
jgi:DNA polymerase-3 subunit epsilon